MGEEERVDCKDVLCIANPPSARCENKEVMKVKNFGMDNCRDCHVTDTVLLGFYEWPTQPGTAAVNLIFN